MENATKALEIAAGVLISILVLGLIIYAYNNLSDLKQIQQDKLSAEQIVDYNKKFDVYNKELYGSELISLANLMEDYNNKEIEKGYKNISLEVEFKNTYSFSNKKLENRNKYSQIDIIDFYENLSDKIKRSGNIKQTGGSKEQTGGSKEQTVQQWSKESTKTILQYFPDQNNNVPTWLTEYKNLTTTQTDLVRAKFKCTNTKYDSKNGRITRMEFVEI